MDEHQKTSPAAEKAETVPPSGKLIRPRPVRPPVPETDPEPIRVLARMPNLDADPPRPRASRNDRRHREEGRILNSRIAVPLLVGVGVLLVALAVVPSMFNSDEAADVADRGDAPAWRTPGDDLPATLPSPSRDDIDGPTVLATADMTPNVQTPASEIGRSTSSSGPAVVQALSDPSAGGLPTVQIEASSLDQPAAPSHDGSPEAVASWRDPGRWPYGSGVDRPGSGTSIAQHYLEAGGRTVARPAAAADREVPVAYSAPLDAGRPALGPHDGSESHTVGMNRAMTLGGQPAADPVGSPIGAQRALAGPYGSAPQGPATNDRYASRPDRSVPYPGTPPANPAPTYPDASRPNPNSSPGGYPVSGDSSAPYGPGPWAGTQVPGTARLQGVIEKPTVRTTYDYDRPSVH